MTKTLLLVTPVALVLVLYTSNASAAVFTLDAEDSGFVTEMGGSAKGDGTLTAGATYNYSVGYELHYVDGSLGFPTPGTTTLAPMDRNNYFVFDLSSVTGTIVGASLLLPTGLYESTDPTEIFDIVAPSAPGPALADIDALAVSNSIGPTEFDMPSDPAVGMAMALYGNIEAGAGDVLASAIISSADDFSTISIPFAPPGLVYLDSFIGGPVVLGGTVPTAIPVVPAPPPPVAQQPFGGVAPGIPASPPGSDPSIPMLVIETIPEPSSMCLLFIGLVCLSRTRSNVK